MQRARRDVSPSLRLPGRGATLITTDRRTLAEELWSCGEDSVYRSALQMSDEETVRLWRHAGRLLVDGKARSSGEAAALAAVALIEGKQRPLVRKRRRTQAGRIHFEQTPEERYAEISRDGGKRELPKVTVNQPGDIREHWPSRLLCA